MHTSRPPPPLAQPFPGPVGPGRRRLARGPTGCARPAIRPIVAAAAPYTPRGDPEQRGQTPQPSTAAVARPARASGRPAGRPDAVLHSAAAPEPAPHGLFGLARTGSGRGTGRDFQRPGALEVFLPHRPPPPPPSPMLPARVAPRPPPRSCRPGRGPRGSGGRAGETLRSRSGGAGGGGGRGGGGSPVTVQDDGGECVGVGGW